jgi:hypothetical protein
VLLGRCDRVLEAQLPGGPLRLEWPADDADVRMTGSATEVYEGEVDLDRLERALAERGARSQELAHA